MNQGRRRERKDPLEVLSVLFNEIEFANGINNRKKIACNCIELIELPHCLQKSCVLGFLAKDKLQMKKIF